MRSRMGACLCGPSTAVAKARLVALVWVSACHWARPLERESVTAALVVVVAAALVVRGHPLVSHRPPTTCTPL